MLKPVQIAKIIVCSLLASAILSACQKAPSRPLKAGMGNPNNKVGQQSFAECNSKSLELLKQRETLLAKIMSLIGIATVRKLTDDEKIELKKFGIDLESLTKLVVEEIKLIKNPKPNAGEGCEQVDSKEPSKKTQYKVKEILEHDAKIQANIVAATKSVKTGLGEEGEVDANSSVNRPKTIKDQLATNETYKISERLVSALAGVGTDKNLIVYEEAVVTDFTDEQVQQFVDLTLGTKKNYCRLEKTTDIGKYTSESVLKVVLVDTQTVKANDDTDLIKARVLMTSDEFKILSWICQVKNKSELQKSLRKNFSKNLIFVDKNNL